MEPTESSEISTEQMQADIAAGFNEVTETPTETPAILPQEPLAIAAEPAPEVPVEEEKTFLGFKESELKEKLAKLSRLDEIDQKIRDTVAGNYGGIKQEMERLRESQKSGKVRVNPKFIERLKTQFDDEFAQSFVDLLEHDAATEPPRTGLSPEDFERRLEEAKLEINDVATKNLSIRVLDMKHPDRKTVTKTPEYQTWFASQPEGERTKINTSWDLDYAAGKLDEFKAWNAKRRTNAQRLETATVTKPKPGTAPATLSEEQAIRQGFDSVFNSP